MTQQFFTDNTIRRWILQIIRVLSNFTVQYGLDNNGNQLYSRVPVVWGDGTFSAATVMRMNSENTLPSLPLMSIYVNNLKYDRSRVQDPTFVDTKSVRTRQYDPVSGSYLPAQANAYNVKRFMPVPYNLEVKVDIVTSNTQQKLQLLEQLLPLFNPAMEIQKTDNYMDWESLSYLELTEVIWSNRTIPVGQGNDSSYDVCSLAFQSPIWLSLPAQVSKMGVIFKVINNIDGFQDDYLKNLTFNTRQVVTYNNYGIFVQDGQIRILNQGVDTVNNSNINTTLYGQPLDWTGILGAYGKIESGISQLGLTYDGSANEILGTITVDPIDSTILLYNVDSASLPANTLPAINAIVNPQLVAPGYGLPTANTGQSYLLLNDVGSASNDGTYIGESPTGIIDGTNTVFTLSFSPIDLDTLYVSKNGLILTNGTDYFFSGTTIKFLIPPATSDMLYAYYMFNNTNVPDGFVNEVPVLAGEPTSRIYNLSQIPFPVSSLTLLYNGQMLTYNRDFMISGSIITLSFIPSSNDSLLAYYRTANDSTAYVYFDGIIPSGIVDGTNRVFSLPTVPSSLKLFYNGILLNPPNDYTLVGNTITYAVAPVVNSSQLAYYSRYSLTAGAWPYNANNSNINAKKNDIVTYNGSEWAITFDSQSNIGNIAFVFNDADSSQYQWNGNAWIAGWEGPYDAAHWRLIL